MMKFEQRWKPYSWAYKRFKSLEPEYWYMDHGYNLYDFQFFYDYSSGDMSFMVLCRRRKWSFKIREKGYDLNNESNREEIVDKAFIACKAYFDDIPTWGV